jgi:poly(glycerol-phosphate) alpha-glucosyltransferase
MTPECNLPEGFAARAAMTISTDVADIERGLAAAAALTNVERRRMSEVALELARSTFSRDAVGTRMITLYDAAYSGARTVPAHA